MSDQRRSIFITGGASGIGRAVARYFGDRGWFVCIADVNAAGMQDTLGMIEGGFKYSHILDVRDRDAWDVALEAAATAAGGRIDVMVNNAGIGTGGRWRSSRRTRSTPASTSICAGCCTAHRRCIPI